MSPFTPRYVKADMATGAVAESLVNQLSGRVGDAAEGASDGGDLRRQAADDGFVHRGWRSPSRFRSDAIDEFRALLTELRAFIDATYVTDAQALGTLFPTYYNIGAGPSNLLSYGVFDRDGAGDNLLDARPITRAARLGRSIRHR